MTIKLAGELPPLFKSEITYKTPMAQLIEGYCQEDPPACKTTTFPPNHSPRRMSKFRGKITSSSTQNCHTRPSFNCILLSAQSRWMYKTKNAQSKWATKESNMHSTVYTCPDKVKNIAKKKPQAHPHVSWLLYPKITNQKNGRMGETIKGTSTLRNTAKLLTS